MVTITIVGAGTVITGTTINSGGARRKLREASSRDELNFRSRRSADRDPLHWCCMMTRSGNTRVWSGAKAPDTRVSTFTQALYDEPKKDGWTVISMKSDWKRIFALE
jgi:hypothetical protein